MEGSWTLLPEPGSLAVGPSLNDHSWWSVSAAQIEERGCQFDDVYKFNAGTFNEADSTWTGHYELILDGSTWREEWQATTEGCGAPVAPHDASNAPFTYTVDLINETVTLTGIGAYMGLPKVYNGGELSATNKEYPESITYQYVYIEGGSNDDIAIFQVEPPNMAWKFKFVKK